MMRLMYDAILGVNNKQQNKNENKIHSDFFPIELKSKETRFHVSFHFKGKFF